MKILICEDEKPTADRLIQLLLQYDSNLEILDVVDSVNAAIKWFQNNPMPDLIFQDIELSDGNCFQIFEKINISTFIIFTTAYSDYVLESYSQNSIDYLVKPYDFTDIKESLEKLKKMKSNFQLSDVNIHKPLLQMIEKKSRLLVKLGDFYKTIQTNDISFIQSEQGVSIAYLFSGEKHILDLSLNELEVELDSKLFFRINRSMMVNFQSIQSIQQWFSGRLKLELKEIKNHQPSEIIVSRNRTGDFKKWLNA